MTNISDSLRGFHATVFAAMRHAPKLLRHARIRDSDITGLFCNEGLLLWQAITEIVWLISHEYVGNLTTIANDDKRCAQMNELLGNRGDLLIKVRTLIELPDKPLNLQLEMYYPWACEAVAKAICYTGNWELSVKHPSGYVACHQFMMFRYGSLESIMDLQSGSTEVCNTSLGYYDIPDTGLKVRTTPLTDAWRRSGDPVITGEVWRKRTFDPNRQHTGVLPSSPAIDYWLFPSGEFGPELTDWSSYRVPIWCVSNRNVPKPGRSVGRRSLCPEESLKVTEWGRCVTFTSNYPAQELADDPYGRSIATPAQSMEIELLLPTDAMRYSHELITTLRELHELLYRSLSPRPRVSTYLNHINRKLAELGDCSIRRYCHLVDGHAVATIKQYRQVGTGLGLLIEKDELTITTYYPKCHQPIEHLVLLPTFGNLVLYYLVNPCTVDDFSASGELVPLVKFHRNDIVPGELAQDTLCYSAGGRTTTAVVDLARSWLHHVFLGADPQNAPRWAVDPEELPTTLTSIYSLPNEA